ncbi:MAG: hypothetical protein OEU26_16440, partial [Candidatus Tectomicrobia bacterium]|nr:hypothetical protein [Candidatus Tectomicrobia bacterium]
MIPRTDTGACLDQLTCQLKQLQHTFRLWRLGLLAAVAVLALALCLRPVPQPGQPVLISQAGGKVLLRVDEAGTPMLRLEAGKASMQLATRRDGTAVLLLSDGAHQRQATLLAKGLRLEQG